MSSVPGRCSCVRGALCLLIAYVSSNAGVASAQAIAQEDLLYNDVVRIDLLQGGDVEARVVATDGLALIVVIDEKRMRIEFAIVGGLELLAREGVMPLPAVAPPPLDDADAVAARLRRAKRRATGLAIASFVLPGTGQFANRQPMLGATYLAGILILDTIIALSLIVNRDPVVATVLGIVDVAARVTSAELARSEAMRASRQMGRGSSGREGTKVPLIAWVTPTRDGSAWALALGVSLRL